MEELTLSEAKERVRREEPSMDKIISIDDVRQDVDSWQEVDKDKLADSLHMDMGDAWTYPHNHPYSDLILDLAIKSYMEDMVRIPEEHLNPDKFQTAADCVIEGYWLYGMTNDEVRELVYEHHDNIEFFYEYEDEIRMEIDSAVMEARLDF